MATTTRQTAIFGVEDWKQIYQTYREADFQSYDFETLRKSFVDYLRLYYPETFNDYIESSEFIALLDIIAFMGQSLAFRTDLNTRENYMDTAERRDSVVGQIKTQEKRWIVDIDMKSEEALLKIMKLVNSCRPEGNKIYATIPTKSGYHLITGRFDVMTFNKIMSLQGDVPDIQKKNPTLLFLPKSLED